MDYSIIVSCNNLNGAQCFCLSSDALQCSIIDWTSSKPIAVLHFSILLPFGWLTTAQNALLSCIVKVFVLLFGDQQCN
jgi:hypothetical protein